MNFFYFDLFKCESCRIYYMRVIFQKNHQTIFTKLTLLLCSISLLFNLGILIFTAIISSSLFDQYYPNALLQFTLLIVSYLLIQIIEQNSVFNPPFQKKRPFSEYLSYIVQMTIMFLIIIISMVIQWVSIPMSIGGVEDHQFIINLIYGVFIVPVAEELAFRGLLVVISSLFLQKSTSSTHIYAKIKNILTFSLFLLFFILQAIIFGYLHGYENLLFIGLFSFLGICFALYNYDLTPIILIHMVINFIVYLSLIL